MIELLALLGAGLLGYALISKKVESGPLTAPLCFTALGIGAGSLLTDKPALDESASWVHVLAEITLVLVLFSDASRIPIGRLRREHALPLRLLVVGMPLTIVLGTAIAYGMMPGLGVWAAALLASILTPTDAALGQAVVSSPVLPVRIRQTLNVESGLNDGIAYPAVFFFLSAAESLAPEGSAPSHWLGFVALQLGLGPLIGIAVGYAGGRALERAHSRGTIQSTFERISVVGLSVLAFALADLVGGNGFIAAFTAGLTVGNVAKAVSNRLIEFGETEGQLLSLVTFSLFGALIVPEALAKAGPIEWIYAVLSLTVIRFLPVMISLMGTGLEWSSVGFLGWFGPRGLASILFLLIAVEESQLPELDRLQSIVGLTVLMSVVAHGMTAAPFSRWYGRKMKHLESHRPESVEHRSVTTFPLRHGGHRHPETDSAKPTTQG